jgi:ribosomal protein S18 acetylase RimI-like enzyme
MPHPQRDEVIAAVRGWHRQPYHWMGWRHERLSVGHYRWHDSNSDRSWAWVTLEDPPLDDDELLVAIGDECGDWPIPRIRIDDAATNAALGPRLLARGWSVDGGNVTLCWAGAPPARTAVGGVEIDDAPDLEEWSITKLRGFTDDDAEPTRDSLRGELGLRRAEVGGISRLQLARVDDEPVAVIGWYEDGQDVDVFNLATRLDWRGRGIARQLLTSCVAGALDAGARAVVIGTDADDTPQQWYRRLGFSDELLVVWTYTPPR